MKIQRTLLIALLVALLAISALPQEAKIKHLTIEDGAAAKTAYEAFKKAEKEWNDTKARVGKKYVAPDRSWGSEFTFTEDFKAVVPAAVKLSSTGTLTFPCGGSGGLTFSTAN